MIINKLILENFRQFKNIQQIDLNIKKDKNVIVILGENTSGKSTIMQAFNWALYGFVDFKDQDCLNEEVKQKMKKNELRRVSVELELTHNKSTFVIRKEQNFRHYSDKDIRSDDPVTTIVKRDSGGKGQPLSTTENDDTINRILPVELSEYFFFSGERISAIGNNSKIGKKEISTAVKRVLGLSTLEKALELFDKRKTKNGVFGIIQSKIDDTGNVKLQECKKRIEENTILQSKKHEDMLKKDQEIQKLKKISDNNDKILLQNKHTTEIKARIKANEFEMEQLKIKLATSIKRLKSEFSRNANYFFIKPIIAKAIRLLHNYGVLEDGIPDMHSKAVDFLIKRQKCICGTPLVEGAKAYDEIIRAKEKLPPQSLSTCVTQFVTKTEDYNKHSAVFMGDFQNEFDDYLEFSKKLRIYEEDNQKLSKEIQSAIDVGHYEKQNEEIKNAIDKYEKDIDDLEKELTTIELQLENDKKEQKELAKTSKKNELLYRCSDLAETIYDLLNQYYSKAESEIREKLQDKINTIFGKMYHGSRNVEIDNNYQYRLITKNSELDHAAETDKSTGLETVISFAFVSGIVLLAKEKITNIDSEYTPQSEPYPLVMDAPFSNADEIHISNISKTLPGISEQIIILIMEKDWKFSKSELGKYLNRTYKLKKESETCTKIVTI